MEMLKRPRRLRGSEVLRKMVRETRMDKASLIYPMFVKEGTNQKEEIPTMPGQYRYTVDRVSEQLDALLDAGVTSVMLFGIPDHKDEVGSSAWAEDGIIQKALRAIKREYADQLYVITDVCMCEYTSHGHCGMLCGCEVDNDKSLELLSRTALSHIQAGADMVAPSDMMDGRVGAIRQALDENRFENVLIMAYSVKYSSSFYGPFRDAADSAPSFGDRKSYQMDFRNKKEAIIETQLDIDEGADIIMVKPGMPYLDIAKTVSDTFSVPLAIYHVSGEYSMIKAAAQNGWIDEKSIVLESLTAMKRAGAKMLITYYAVEAAKWLEEN